MPRFDRFFGYIMSTEWHSDLESIGMNSYVHPNGFTKLVLPSLSDGVEEYRFHIWPRGEAETDIHNHTSSFNSLVLAGCIREELFQKIPGQQYVLHKCTARSVTGTATLIPVEPCDALQVGSRTVQAHQMYEIDLNQYHRVSASTMGTTITLVEQLTKQRDHSFVIVNSSAEQSAIPLINPPLRREDLLRAIETCRETASAYLERG